MWIYKELEKRLCRCLYILFLKAAIFADVCIFSVPPPSLGIVSVPCNWRHIHWLSATYICRFYILHRKVDSAWANNSGIFGCFIYNNSSIFGCFWRKHLRSPCPCLLLPLDKWPQENPCWCQRIVGIYWCKNIMPDNQTKLGQMTKQNWNICVFS